MTVLAMRVVTAAPHPNADALRVYTFAAPEQVAITVVANLEHVYEVGDVVAIARVGATLRDGTEIRRQRLRGVDSFGMALGVVADEVGTDLSARLALPPAEATTATSGVALAKWPKIELLHNVRAAVAAIGEGSGEPARLVYRAKVKLDGTNAAVHLLADGVVAQSRTRTLTVADDNHGFARWVDDNRAYLASLYQALGRAVIYGEWCGCGIQKRTAVSSIDRKVFAVFAIQLGDPTVDAPRLLVDPDAIAKRLTAHPDVFVLPWHGPAFAIDFGSAEALEATAAHLNELVSEVEACDPWVEATFGSAGTGEGVVLYPTEGFGVDARGPVDRDLYAQLLFKAKGEAHRVVRQRAAVQVAPEVARDVEDFATLFLTPARLEQGLGAVCSGAPRMRDLGPFLRWIANDVRAESDAELQASGLEWRQVSKAVSDVARTWFQDLVTRQP